MLSNDSPNCCVIDTDVSTGSTRQLIAKIFSGADFFAPIVLKENEDLIDLEDLLYQRSYLVRGDVIEQVSYLLNGDFFKARTSLSQTTYQTLLGLLG